MISFISVVYPYLEKVKFDQPSVAPTMILEFVLFIEIWYCRRTIL